MTDRPQRRSKRQETEGVILDKKFRLIPLDDKNIELQELVNYLNKEDVKQTEWRWKSYHHTIANGIKEYCNIRTLRAKNMEDLLSILEELHTKIDDQFQVHLNGNS